MKKLVTVAVILVVLIVVFLILSPFYILREGEQAVIVRFGKIENSETVAGLHYKTPVLDTIVKYPKRVLTWDGDPQQLPTKSNQFIWVDSTARWRITDPVKFYSVVNTIEQGYARLDDVIDSSVRTVIAQYELDEVVRNTNFILEKGSVETLPAIAEGDEAAPVVTKQESIQKNFVKISSGRRQLSRLMLEMSRSPVADFGIEILDVVIRQIRYSEQLTESVENRMITERKQIAQQFRSLGEGAKQKWLGKLDNERQSIMSRAYSESESIKGAAEAKVTRIYAQAYSVDSSFFDFWRGIESYRKTLPNFKKTLTTDLDYFKFLYNANAGQ